MRAQSLREVTAVDVGAEVGGKVGLAQDLRDHDGPRSEPPMLMLTIVLTVLPVYSMRRYGRRL